MVASYSVPDLLILPDINRSFDFMAASASGVTCLVVDEPMHHWTTWDYSAGPNDVAPHSEDPSRMFGVDEVGIWFPLWYPALLFALAGVGVICFRRQFSIRATLICVSVVALLLGMAVAL